MYALIDCNSFFVSCEKVFRPDLQGKAVVVLSNNDGIIVARSAEAKKLGIVMGETYFNIKRLVEAKQVVAFSSNYRLYTDFSRRVMNILGDWCPNVEIYSVDEAFLDFRDNAVDNREALGKEIVSTIRQWTGIPVTIGFAPTKTLCKIACETAKNNETGVGDVVEPSIRNDTMQTFPVDEVWGVGRRLVPKFHKLGLRTALDLSRVDPLWMRKNYSVIQEKTVRELCGEPCFTVDDAPEPKKSIQVSRSFGEATDRLEDLEAAVATFAAKAAEKARAQNSVASAVYVHINTSWYRQGKNEYYSNGVTTPFPVPTSGSLEILETSLTALRKIFRPKKLYKKATVVLLDLKNADAVYAQKLLFEPDENRTKEDKDRERKLMETLDAINRQHGRGTVFFGIEGVEKSWRPLKNSSSPGYTTSWNELPVVK